MPRGCTPIGSATERTPASSESRLAMNDLSGIAASATLLCCLVLVATGCAAPSGEPQLLTYRPPLSISASALTTSPGSARVAKHALQRIAATMSAPPFSSKAPVRVRYVEYQLMFINAGSAEAFTADQTVADEVTVQPDSSAMISERVLSSPHFASKVDRLHWQAAGRPPFAGIADHVGSSFHRTLPAGAWSFAPQGRARLTFKRVRALPSEKRALTLELAQLLTTSSDTPPAAALSLRQYGFLLATAPLARTTRQALLDAMGSLPRIHECDALFPTGNPRGDAFCDDGDPTSTAILLDPHTGVALIVCERLNKRSPLYPNMAVGDLVGSYTFTPQSFGSAVH